MSGGEETTAPHLFRDRRPMTADGVCDQEILFGTDFTDSTDGILCRKNQSILVFPA